MWTILFLHLYLETSLMFLMVASDNLSFDPIPDSTVYNFRPPSHFEKITAEDAQRKDKKYRREHLQNWSLRRGGGASASASASASDSHASSYEDHPPPSPPSRHTAQTTRQTLPIWSQPDRNRPYFGHPGNNDRLGMERDARDKVNRNQNGGHYSNRGKNEAAENWNEQDNGATNRWTGHHHQPTPKPKSKPKNTLRFKPMASAKTPLDGNGPPIGPWSEFESHKNGASGSPKHGEKVTTLWNVAPHGGYVLTEETIKPDFRSDHPGATWSTPVTNHSHGNKNDGRWKPSVITPVHSIRSPLSTTTTRRPSRSHNRRTTSLTTTMATWGKRWNQAAGKVSTTPRPRHLWGQQWTPPTVSRPSEAELLDDGGDDDLVGGDMAWGLLGQRDTKPNGTWRKEDPLTSKRIANDEAENDEPDFEDFHEPAL